MEPLCFRAPGVALGRAALLDRAARDGESVLEEVALEPGGPLRPRRPIPPGVQIRARAPGESLRPLPKLAGGAAVALVPRLAWLRGELDPLPDRPGTPLAFEVAEIRGRLAEVMLRCESDRIDPREILRRLAAAGSPVLADVRHGGILIGGGLRLREPGPEPVGWWPDEPVFPDDIAADDGGPPPHRISPEARRALARGHPWLLADPGSEDIGRFAPGTLVGLRDRDRSAGFALVDGSAAVAARIWSRSASRPREVASVEARVAAALAKRRSLLQGDEGSGATDAFRLVHGEADALPGVAVDRLGSVLRVLVQSRCTDDIRTRMIDALVHQLAPAMGGDPPVVEVLALPGAPPGRLECVRCVRGRLDTERVEVRERGLVFQVDPGLGAPDRPRPGVGLFADQRENRARLAACAERGGRWLNLFAHTGAFSAALLAAGAEEVVSVDLSAAYLDWLETNLERNGLADGRHRAVRQDGRRFLENLDASERFAGIVLDPPTAAAAGRRFWSVSQGFEPLLGAALARLEPGGVLLACRNDRRARAQSDSLPTSIRRAAGQCGVMLESVQPAPPGGDFPSLRGFPEGDPFRGALVQRAFR